MRVAAALLRASLAALAALAAATRTVDEITKAAPTYDWHAARQWHGPMTEPHARPRARKPSYAIRAT